MVKACWGQLFHCQGEGSEGANCSPVLALPQRLRDMGLPPEESELTNISHTFLPTSKSHPGPQFLVLDDAELAGAGAEASFHRAIIDMGPAYPPQLENM